MPYIPMADREKFIINLRGMDLSPGELNYLITGLCNAYLYMHKLSYETFNDIIGVLECAKLEMYRRQVAPYEDIKMEENGDV